MEIEIERKKIDIWDALIFHDEIEEQYVVTLAEKGGAIISHNDKVEAIKIWTEAMIVSESTYKLLYFKENGHFPNK